MRRYLLFAGYNYYPSGGWNDFVTSHESIEALRRYPKYAASVSDFDESIAWAHIVDTQTG